MPRRSAPAKDCADGPQTRPRARCEPAGIIRRTVGIEVVCRVLVASCASMASAVLAQDLSPAAQQATAALKAFADDDLPKQLEAAVTPKGALAAKALGRLG